MKTLLILLFLASCASTTRNKTSVDLDSVTNTDFKAVKQKRYSKLRDFNKNIESPRSGATNDESIHRALLFDGDIDDETIYGKVTELCVEKKFEQAFIVIKNNSRAYTQNPSFWNLVGNCYLLQGERRLALLFLNKALDLNARYAPVYNNLGVMYLTEGDYPRAQVAFEKAVSIDNYSKTPRLNLANLFLQFGLYDESRSLLQVLLRSNKNDLDSLNLMGTTYLLEQNVKRAISFYNKIPDDYYERPEFGINIALAHWGINKKEKAKDILEDVEIKQNKSWSDYYKKTKKLMKVK